QKNPRDWTGGDEGLGYDYAKVPAGLVGILNTKHLYWLALAYAVVVGVIVWWATRSSPGHVWQAIRENERRVEVLGLRPHPFKLQLFVLSSTLAAAGGIVYMLLYSGSTLAVTAPTFTLTLLLMVVIGGAGSRWGAVLGGILYTYLDDRLTAIGSSSAVGGLPHALRTPLEQPLFLLGVIFILIVFFLPGGLAGLAARGRPSGLRRLEEAIRTEPTITAPPEEAS